MAELKDKIAALESRVRGHSAAMLGLARMLQEDGQNDKALAMCRAALGCATPSLPELARDQSELPSVKKIRLHVRRN